MKGLFDLTRPPALIVLFLALASGIFWFGWDSWASRPGLDSLKKGDGFWIAFVFVLSAGFSLISILLWLRKFLISAWLEIVFGR